MDTCADRLPRLPACQLCYQKKIKCDSTRPKCTPCTKNGSECIILISSGEETLSRAEINHLEQQERELSARLQNLEDVVRTTDPTDQRSTDVGQTVSSIEGSNVSHGEGLGFMASLFTDPDLRRNNTELLQILAKVPSAPEPTVVPCGLPSSEDAEVLFEKYLSWSHVLNPCLCRDEVRTLYRRIFSSRPDNRTFPDYDLFRAFLILAIGSIFPYQNGTHSQHPEGYYLAALQHMGADFLTRGLDSVQDLLLVCRFGIYHRIGTSIWDVIRLCGRLCIEQGLHLDDRPRQSLLRTQMERRVFWQFYMIDRYSSTLLGKPFAIDDHDIETGFPADANDEDLVAANQSIRDLAEFQMSHVSLEPNEMSVFFTSIRLRQISSKIHTEFSKLARNHSEPSQNHLAPGHIYTTLGCLMQELQKWRDHAPNFQQPKCLFESQDWYDLLLAREQLYLVRRAIDLLPKRDSKIPRHVSILYLRTALSTIRVYSTLFQHRPLITHTRSYFHMMFTAGLSVMFCVSSATALDQEDVQRASDGLQQCEETLRDMVEQLSSARHYIIVFEALRRNTSRKLNRIAESLRSNAIGSAGINERWNSTVSSANLGRPSFNFRSGLHTDTGGETTGNRPNSGVQSYQSAEDTMSGHFNFSFPLDRTNGDTTSSLLNVGSNYTSLEVPENFSPDSDLFDWAFLNDDTLWNMETVLGEYVYGDPTRQYGFLDTFEF
ncbi:Zn(II)2Cys6 transcription factor [Colletotrichum truncatum]|uniref:Zn(II)2Cys6 transcription factor n=1 Tax=Colletotrichum truncatum TaxID=5467 RepID=A0ACC3YI48_COLTU|nr:Zn(II)2Cys6 transcription factor [Colletotrichum truncatum]KAF6786112.1 Zn(II)2Cys6 transcription factor [Colletotrichum truncatum]